MPQKVYIFHDESGSPGKDTAFLACALRLTGPRLADLYELISEVRKRHHYYEELHFYKSSSLKHTVYREVLDTALRSLSFSCKVIVVLRDRLDMRYFSRQNYLAYNYFTKQVIYHQLKDTEGRVYIYSDAKNRVKRDNFIRYLGTQLNLMALEEGHDYCVRTVETLNPDSAGPRTLLKQRMLYEALQFADLLTGAVKHRYDPATSWRKLDLRNLVQYHAQSYKVNVWEWQPKQEKQCGR